MRASAGSSRSTTPGCSPCSAWPALSRLAVALLGQQRDHPLDEAGGDGLARREPQRALARQVGREFGREGGIGVRHRIQRDVVLPPRELDQALAVKRHGGNLVADRLAGPGNNAENPAAYFAQDRLNLFRERTDVLLDRPPLPSH